MSKRCAWFGSVSSLQNARHAVKVEVHELENQTFFSPDKQT